MFALKLHRYVRKVRYIFVLFGFILANRGEILPVHAHALGTGGTSSSLAWSQGNLDAGNVTTNLQDGNLSIEPMVRFVISGNAGVADVILSYTDVTPKTAVSDASGNYSFTVPFNWSGTVTPAKTGYTFIPASRTYVSVLAELTGQDYAAEPITYSLPLVAGWNLVSFRLHPTDTSIVSVLSSLGDQYSLVYAWDAVNSKWLIYDPTLGALNDLLNLDETLGFWIKMKTAQTLVVSGSVPTSTSIDLQSGWNLVGYPSASNAALPDALSTHGLGTDFSLVYAYHASEGSSAWKLFDRLGNPLLNDLVELSPGWGYWVKASVAHTWTVP